MHPAGASLLCWHFSTDTPPFCSLDPAFPCFKGSSYPPVSGHLVWKAVHGCDDGDHSNGHRIRGGGAEAPTGAEILAAITACKEALITKIDFLTVDIGLIHLDIDKFWSRIAEVEDRVSRSVL